MTVVNLQRGSVMDLRPVRGMSDAQVRDWQGLGPRPVPHWERPVKTMAEQEREWRNIERGLKFSMVLMALGFGSALLAMLGEVIFG